jgi:lysophospholipase L1-like esterase
MPRFEFYNRGIGNQTSAQVVARFQEHVTPLQPDLIIIQVGVNDLKTIPIFPERREEIVANCKANIEQLVNQSLELDAIVVLTTIFPLGEVPLERRLFWSEDVAVAIDEVNEFISSLKQEEVLVLNTGMVLADEEGEVRKAYSRDLLHLTETGYEALNEELVIVLRDVVP